MIYNKSIIKKELKEIIKNSMKETKELVYYQKEVKERKKVNLD